MAGNASALNRIFQEELGRDIGAEGAQYFGGDLAQGQSLGQIRRSVQNSAEAQANRQQNTPPIGLIGSEQALRSGLQGSLAGITEGLDRAGESIAQGQSFLQPFAGAGGQAIGLQAALSGASGSDAQQQAFSNFNSSPGQNFLRNRGERALLRNSGAIGGLGGGRVRQALTEHGIGTAQQDFSNQFQRLGQISGMGLQGAGQQAGLSAQLAGDQALGGRTAGGFAFGTGQALSAGRQDAASQIAQAIGGTTQGLANLQQQQGAGQADIIGSTTGNLANILAGAGQQQAGGQTQLATLLANLATQQGSQTAGLPGIPGIQQTQGLLSGLGQAAGGFGTGILAAKQF